jgi:hypothetical protein
VYNTVLLITSFKFRLAARSEIRHVNSQVAAPSYPVLAAQHLNKVNEAFVNHLECVLRALLKLWFDSRCPSFLFHCILASYHRLHLYWSCMSALAGGMRISFSRVFITEGIFGDKLLLGTLLDECTCVCPTPPGKWRLYFPTLMRSPPQPTAAPIPPLYSLLADHLRRMSALGAAASRDDVAEVR